MWFVLSHYWIAAVLALGVGIVVGALTQRHGTDTTRWSAWLFPAVGFVAIATVLMLLKVLPGRTGVWLESGVILLGFYVLGCVAGSWLKAQMAEPVSVLPRHTQEHIQEPIMHGVTVLAPVPEIVTSSTDVSVEPPLTSTAKPNNKPLKAPVKKTSSKQATPLQSAPEPALITEVKKPKTIKVVSKPKIASKTQTDKNDASTASSNNAPSPQKIKAAPKAKKETPIVQAVETVALSPQPILPPLMPAVEGEEQHSGKRPVGYISPIEGKGDDLKIIKGIAKLNEGRLHSLGIWHFHQIAVWTDDEITWVGSYLAFPGRIQREKWVEQAKALVK
jgi:predicted flap endonuclease-1-like 5' DNA nuclease